MSYFSLYYNEKCITHSFKLSLVDLLDLRSSVCLLQHVRIQSDVTSYLCLYMYEKCHLYGSLSGNDPKSHRNFTKHTEILFPQIQLESNHGNSVP